MEKNSKNSKFLSFTTKKLKFFSVFRMIFLFWDTKIGIFDHNLANLELLISKEENGFAPDVEKQV